MNKLKDFESMKGITIILVVLAHVTRMFTPKGVIPIAYSYPLELFTEIVYMFHMPAFVMISGAVYYYVKREKGKYADQKIYVLNKFKRIVLPFFFFSLAIVIPVLLYTGLRTDMLYFLMKEVFLMAPETHLWYSIMIFNVFVVFNFIEKRIHHNASWLNWSIFISLNLTSFLIPNAFQVMNTFNYLVYFYIGYWFQQNRERVNLVMKNKLPLAVMLTVSGYIGLFASPISSTFFLKRGLQIVVAISGSLMLYLVSAFSVNLPFTKNSVFKKITADSYGIYLFHPMIIYLLSFWMKDLGWNPYLITTLIFAVSLALSMFFVDVFRKVNFHVFIGEGNKEREKDSKTAVSN